MPVPNFPYPPKSDKHCEWKPMRASHPNGWIGKMRPMFFMTMLMTKLMVKLMAKPFGNRPAFLGAIGLVLPLMLSACLTTEPANTSAPSADSSSNGQPTADALMAAGTERAARGEFMTAAALFRSAHDISPNAIEPLIALGDALSAANAHRDAASAYEKASKVTNARAEAFRGLGNARILLGDYDAARQSFLVAVERAPNDWRNYLGLGVAYDMLGLGDSARLAYRRGLEIDPENADLRLNHGLSLALTDQFDLALRHLGVLVSMETASPQARQTLAFAYTLSGDEETARRWLAVDMGVTEIDSTIDSFRAIGAIRDPIRRARAMNTRNLGLTE